MLDCEMIDDGFKTLRVNGRVFGLIVAKAVPALNSVQN